MKKLKQTKHNKSNLEKEPFTKGINQKKWPSPSKRTIKRVLTYMSKKTGLFTWDIISICLFISFVLAFLLPGAYELQKAMVLGLKLILFLLAIRIIFMLYYHLRSYKKSMLKHYDFYGGQVEHSRLLENLENSLKERMLYYSPQWIITEDFFLSWCKSSYFFDPIAIPFNEILSLKYEVRKNVMNSGTVIYDHVIICQLKSCQFVDLYIGNQLKSEVILKILNYFHIPFQNGLNPAAPYTPPYDIAAIPPHKMIDQKLLSSEDNFAVNPDFSIFAPVMNKITKKDMENILKLLSVNRKVLAIKEIMNATGIGLAEAKKIADQYYLKHPDTELH